MWAAFLNFYEQKSISYTVNERPAAGKGAPFYDLLDLSGSNVYNIIECHTKTENKEVIMAVYRIAALNIGVEPQYQETIKCMEPYRVDEGDIDFSVNIDPEELQKFTADSPYPERPDLSEGPLIYTKICKKILSDYNGCFFHSSCLELEGEGYMFTALSGTGKSTHTRNWCKLFGDRVTMINDDKPIIRKIDGKFYVCGTPWMGKSNIGCNMMVPIKAIFVLKRGEENHAEKISPGAVLKELMEATLMPKTRENMSKLLGLFNDIFTNVKLFKLTCNKDIESAQVAYDAAQSN